MDTAYLSLLVGYLTVAYVLYRLVYFLWIILRYYVFTSLGFVKNINQYGEWAVVTGSTDGIGKEYAKQLASRGFNIVLISRTMTKLENVAREIEKESKVKTKIICFDFSKKDGYDKIENELVTLDIGILVNNVGWTYLDIQPFNERPIDTICTMLYTNMFSCVHMTHMVLKGMVQRKRGAVVNVCAGAIYWDCFPVHVYLATKGFMAKLVKSLQLEYSGIIEHQLVVPFGVISNLIKDKPSFGAPTAEDYVKYAIPTIGLTNYTHGCPIHELQGFIAQLLPQCVLTFCMRNVIVPKLFNKKD